MKLLALILFAATLALVGEEKIQNISKIALETAKKFRGIQHELRATEFEVFACEFLQTHIQESGKVVRLKKPIVKKKITEAEVTELLGKPIYSDPKENTISYDLGRKGSVTARGTLVFENEVLVDVRIITTW